MAANVDRRKTRPGFTLIAWLALPLVYVVLCMALDIASAPAGDSLDCHPVGADDEHCGRLTKSRSVPGEHERESARRVAGEIERDLTMRRLGRCSPQCSSGAVPLPGADEIRSWLFEAGHEDAVARIATVEDPAPARSVVYAVRVGSACVVGHQHDGEAAARSYVLGTLPGGGCLDG
jgi:hypothetical protein